MNITAFATLGVWLGHWRQRIWVHWPMLGLFQGATSHRDGTSWQLWLGPLAINACWPRDKRPWPITVDAGVEVNYYALSCKLQLPVEQWWGLQLWPECDSEKNRNYMGLERDTGITAGWIASRKLFLGPVQVWWAYPGGR